MSAKMMLQLSLPHDWERIEVVRQAISLCVGAVFGSVAFRDAIAMVSSELLENAIKHGVPEAGVELLVEQTDHAISVVVANRIERAGAVDALRERIAWIQRFDDPAAAYTAAMEKAFVEMTEGGLGLPRIAHEGGCSLSCELEGTDRVVVRARLDPARFRGSSA
jgi:hypothetical protein